MKRNDSNHNIHTSPANDMPDIEIVDLENETMQDTDSGKSAHKSNKKQTSDVSPKADEYDDFSEEYEEEDYPEEDETPEKVIERLKMKEAAQSSQQPAVPVQDAAAGAEANDRI